MVYGNLEETPAYDTFHDEENFQFSPNEKIENQQFSLEHFHQLCGKSIFEFENIIFLFLFLFSTNVTLFPFWLLGIVNGFECLYYLLSGSIFVCTLILLS